MSKVDDVELASPKGEDFEDEIESLYSDMKENDEDEVSNPILKKIILGFKIALFLGWAAFSIVAFTKDFERAKPLFIMWMVFGGFCLLWGLSYVFSRQISAAADGINNGIEKIQESKPLALGAAFGTIVILGIIIGLSIDSADRLISLAGIAALVGFSFLTSWNKRKIKWRPVIGGLLLQFLFGLIILRWDTGFEAFKWLGDQVKDLLDYSIAGARFVFGDYLAERGKYFTEYGSFNFATQTYTFTGYTDLGGVFATTILPTIIFFSSLVSILYYVGILQVLILVIGRGLSFILGTSAAESLSAAGNIFVGQTEAPLLIRPFIKDMTESEIHSIMTGGFATVAGGVLAAFIGFGIPPSHLIAASVMSAPAALAISKIIIPETEKSASAAGTKFEIDAGSEGNIIEAASNGAQAAIQLVLSIGGQLIAFIAIITMLNAWLAYFGRMVEIGVEPGEAPLSFQMICGYVLYPLTFLMGVDTEDCFEVAQLLGEKIFINEFFAYLNLADLIRAGAISEKSIVIATYALCGFSNFASIGIQLGCLTPMAPNKAKVFARVVFSAMIAGNTACFLTASIAGLLYKA